MLGCDVPWMRESRGIASGSICWFVTWVVTTGVEGKVEEWDCEEGPAPAEGGVIADTIVKMDNPNHGRGWLGWRRVTIRADEGHDE